MVKIKNSILIGLFLAMFLHSNIIFAEHTCLRVPNSFQRGEFRNKFRTLYVCEAMEKRFKEEPWSFLSDNTLTWVKSQGMKFEGVKFRQFEEEIHIEVSHEGLVVRYFDHAYRNPAIALGFLAEGEETVFLSSHLSRQILKIPEAIQVSSKRLLSKWSFVEEKDRTKAKEIAIAHVSKFYGPSLSSLMQVRLIEDDFVDCCGELAINIMNHGRGGDLEVYYIERLSILDAIELVAIDNGPGIDNLNELLKRGKAAHKKARRVLEKRREEWPTGLGFRNIILLPDEVTIETKGKKWVKIGGKNEKEVTLKLIGDSDVVEGAKITLTFDVVKDKTPPNLVRLKEVSGQDGFREKAYLGREKPYGSGFSVNVENIIHAILYYKTIIYEALGNDFNLAVLCRSIKHGSEGGWKDLSDRADLRNFKLENGDEIEICVLEQGGLPESILQFILQNVKKALENEDYISGYSDKNIYNSIAGLKSLLLEFKRQRLEQQFLRKGSQTDI